MKVLETTDTEAVFQPITLSLTIESEVELMDLLSRAWADPEKINLDSQGRAVAKYNRADSDSCAEFWQVLNDICEDRGFI